MDDIQSCFNHFENDATKKVRELDAPSIASRDALGRWCPASTELVSPRRLMHSPRCGGRTPGELRNRQALRSNIFDQVARRSNLSNCLGFFKS
jgi:hypothetical protein